MASERALAVIAVCGCQITDVAQPIALVPDGLDDAVVATLAEAAACWNLRFGTQIVVGPAEDVPQRVDVFFDTHTCIAADGMGARVQAGWPAKIAICPQQYWPAWTIDRITLFEVLAHELGHVLNIIGHPDDPWVTMTNGTSEGSAMFAPIDVAWFAEANPDYAIATACREVVKLRSAERGEHCLCRE
jgi:hypothetical protein